MANKKRSKKNSKKKNTPEVTKIREQEIQAQETEVIETPEPVAEAPEVEAVEVAEAAEVKEPESVKAEEPETTEVTETVQESEVAAPAGGVAEIKDTIVLDPVEVVDEAVEEAAKVNKDTIVLDPGETSLEYKQILTEKDLQDAREEYGDLFRTARIGMGAEAIDEILSSIDVEQLGDELREALDTATGQKKAKIIKRNHKLCT